MSVEQNLNILEEKTKSLFEKYSELKEQLNSLNEQMEILTNDKSILNDAKSECFKSLQQKIEGLTLCEKEKQPLTEYIKNLNQTHNENIQNQNKKNEDRMNELNKRILALTESIGLILQTGGDVKSLKPQPTKLINKKTSNPHVSNFLNNF